MHEILVKSEYFKDSLLGMIPKDWEVVPISSIGEIVTGRTPPSRIPGVWGDTLPFITPGDISADGQVMKTERYLSPIGVNYVRSLPNNAVLVVCIGSTLGKTALATVECATNQQINAIIPDAIHDSRFVYAVVAYQIAQLLRWAGLQAVPIVNKKQFGRMLVPIAPPNEQRMIGEILDSLEQAIARTSSLIAKLKQMKAGLLHDLLTRGLDENGELRDAIAHPEQFKDSPLGQIPKDWGVFQLSEILPRAEYGISVSLEDEDGIPVLRMNNLKEGEVDLTDLKKSASPKATNLLLQISDVLFNRTNSIEHVGRTAIWRGQIEQASFASYLVRLIPDQSKLIPEYLNIWLNLENTQLLIRRYATPGVHQVNINPTNLRKVLIGLPQSIFEQEAIVEKIKFHNNRIHREEAYLEKLKLQKQGLMQDLLTGKVRVNQSQQLEENCDLATLTKA